MKRKLEEFVMRSNKGEQCQNAKNSTHNMESSSGREHVEECLDRANQHTQSDHVPIPFESIPINNTSLDTSMGTVKEPLTVTIFSKDAHLQSQEY